jgi:hypothetical protein
LIRNSIFIKRVKAVRAVKMQKPENTGNLKRQEFKKADIENKQ